MKKINLKINNFTKAVMLVASIAISGFGFASGNGAKVTMALAPFGLVAGMKKKGITLEADEEKTMKGIEDEMNAYYADLAADVRKGLLSEADFNTKLEEKISNLDLTAKGITVPGTGKDGGADKTLAEFLRDRSEEISDLQKASVNTPSKHPMESQRDAIKDLVKGIRTIKNNVGESPYTVSLNKDFDKNEKTDAEKAAVTMTSANTQANASGVTVPTNYMYGVEATPNPDVRIDPYITEFVDNGSTDLAAMPYADKLPTEGTMAITSEGALKPLLSVSLERRFSQAFKIAGRSKVTEEGLDDIPGLQSLVNGELKYSHDIAEQNAVYTHVAAFAPAFVAGSLAATTDTPSNWDAIRAAIYAVKIASKGRFIPNAVVVNSADAYAMGATKDTTKQYVIPTFVLPDGTKVVGVRVVETQDTTNVAAGAFIVGDWKKIKRRVYKPFNLRMGQGINGNSTAANITSDFETNMYTIIGESRLHLWHYKNDETAFIKTTFAAVKTAIATA